MAPAPSGAAVLGTIYTLIVLAALVIAARIYLRIVIQKRRLLASDFIMILAWLSAVTTSSFDIVLKKHGALEADINYTLTNYNPDSEEEFEHVMKMIWASVIPFFTTFYLCKAALVSVYLQLFPPFMKKRRMLLWATIIYCVIAYIVSIALQLFLCFPIERNWSIKEPEKICPEDALKIVFEVAWALHFTGSLALFALPFLILQNLNMRTKTKIGVYCVFLLGLIDIAFSLTRFLTVLLSHVGSFRAITTIELWSALDVYVGLIIACLPSLRPYLRRNFGASYQYDYNESGRVTKSTVTRRPGQSGFEELGEGPYAGPSTSGSRAIPSRHAAESAEFSTDGDDDKKSNRSDIELVNINVGANSKDRAHV
ncbi:hypothetical protein BHE90_008706 [Fusarium euwallaceae]|uniref:Rhodopsin domain-containing protein n=2 Tax=Fusarium solani species complex TaxID=232080 RepID=A0A3M2SEK7_9HYPO|nr:hypothetical protein CDV36_004316 [Fusarium kuroshium]RTE76815.1 hypothetical protein BHE90_008706 [Fusarium euwallaceae]